MKPFRKSPFLHIKEYVQRMECNNRFLLPQVRRIEVRRYWIYDSNVFIYNNKECKE